MSLKSRRWLSAPLLAAVALTGSGMQAADPYEDAPAYVKAVDAGVRKLEPILTVGQQIPATGGGTYRIVGIPGGMGLRQEGRNGAKEAILTVNHEFGFNQGAPFGTLPAGARVSEFVVGLQKGGAVSAATVQSGRLAFQSVYDGETLAELAPLPGGGIGRLCSANLADERVGFDRPIHLSGEESGNPAETFDGKGAQAFAVVDGKAYTLARMGRAPWENVVAAPFTGSKTVLMGLEDGSTLDSQLYMYVGEKNPNGGDALSKNGLNNGKLYVFVGDDLANNSEATFNTKGQSTTGHWVEVEWDQDAASLQAESVAKDSFLFTRLEDGAFDPSTAGVFYFATTGRGGAPGNPYGKLYRVDFDSANPTGEAELTVLIDGSEGIVSPDNIDINKHGELILCEDPNYDLSTLPQSSTRDSSLWFYDTKSDSLTRIVEIDRATAYAHAVAADPANAASSLGTPGSWEVSGVIDAEELLGRGSFLSGPAAWENERVQEGTR